jgi:PAS domain S-box-containing protein
VTEGLVSVQAIIDADDLPCFALDRDLRYTAFNQAHATVMRELYGAEIAIGGRLADYQTVEADSETAQANLLSALAGTPIVASAYSGAGRERRYFDVVHTPRTDDSGVVIGVEVRAHDVTERQRTEIALAESEARFRGYFEQGLIAAAVTSPEKGVIDVNQAYLDLLGYTREELAEKSWDELTHPDDLAADLAQFDRVLAGEIHGYRLEKRFIRKDGRPVDVDMSVRAIRDEKGAAEYFVALVLDITERRAAEAALRESEAMRTIAEGVARVGSYRWDVDLTSPRAFWSEGMYALFDVDPEDFTGDPMPILNSRVHPEDSERVWRIAEAIASSGEAVPVEFRVVHRDGSEHVLHSEFSVERHEADEAASITGYYQDVTEQRRAEAEIRQLNADLEDRVAARTAELEAVNKELEAFAYSISHDLRAPLRAIDGFSAMLAEDAGDRLTPDEVGHLQRVRGGAQRMALLIDELMELSRASRSDMHLEEVDLSSVASSVARDLREAQPERRVEVTIAPGMHAPADAALVRAILANLLGNAWKFTSTHEAAHIEVGVTETGGECAFFVRDDGAGFDAVHAEHLFGAFQRFHTADQFDGDGIGLATVQRLVARHGGRVWAESEIEKGATFYFTLPGAPTSS